VCSSRPREILNGSAQYLTDSEQEQCSCGHAEVGHGLKDSSLAPLSYEPASVSIAMGQEVCWVKILSTYRAKQTEAVYSVDVDFCWTVLSAYPFLRTSRSFYVCT